MTTSLPKTRLKLTSTWSVKARPGKSKKKQCGAGVVQDPLEADVPLGPADVQLGPAVPKTPGAVQAPRFHNFGRRKHSEP